MTEYVTRTKEFGRMMFSAPAADDRYAGYVWLSSERGYAAKERRQICYGGGFMGSAVMARESEVASEAQRWLRHRRDADRADRDWRTPIR